MMTLFSTLMPLISATASFDLACCRLGASFMRAPVELVEIAIHHPHILLTFFFPDRDDRDFKPATGMPRPSQRINHEDTKNTKKDQKKAFALFVSSWLIFIFL